MKTNIIIPTRAARHLLVGAKPSISKATKIIMPEPNKEGSHVFPDGELYFRVPGLKHAKRVVILHSGYPDPNGGLIEIYMLLDIVRLYAPRVDMKIVFASIPYARQDKAYYDGELNAAKTLIENFVKHYGVKWIWAIDAHFANERWLKGLPFTNITDYTNHLIAEARRDHPEMILMAPDAGSTRRMHIKGAKKTRTNSYSVNVDLGDAFAAKVKGKIIGVVDDILSTGTTLERFYHEVKKHGAHKVYALITHGVNPSGISRIKALYDGLYLTNTVNMPEANVMLNQHILSLIEKNLE